MGEFKTDLVWGRNGIYAWACAYCGKHNEKPLGELPGWRRKLPEFCNQKCAFASGRINAKRDLPTTRAKRVVGMKRHHVIKMLPILEDQDIGMTLKELADKYQYSLAGLPISIQKARQYIKEGLDKQ